MKARRMAAKEARAKFADVLGSVYYRNEPVIIEKNGKEVAVVISPWQWAALQQFDAAAWERIARMQEHNDDKDPDEVLADVTAVVEEVRQEMYDERQRALPDRR